MNVLVYMCRKKKQVAWSTGMDHKGGDGPGGTCMKFRALDEVRRLRNIAFGIK